MTAALDPPGWQWGVSYFGVRNPQHFRHDLDDIARLGFTYIVFTFSENDHRFYQGSVAESIRLTQDRGLRAYVDPWGVGGIFGGEAFTERGAWDLEGQQRRSDGRPLPLLCPNSDEARTYLSRWIDTVAEVLRPDAIFWDEPHFYLPFGEARAQGLWACCCVRCEERFTSLYGKPLPDRETADVRLAKQSAIVDLLGGVTALAGTRGLRNVVCLLTDPDNLDDLESKWQPYAAMTQVDVLAADPYPLFFGRDVATTRVFCQALQRLGGRYGKATQMWVQGFRVSQDGAPLLGQEMRLMAACGIRDIAMWSYLATSYMSSHACARPEEVWRVFTQTMAELNAAGD